MFQQFQCRGMKIFMPKNRTCSDCRGDNLCKTRSLCLQCCKQWSLYITQAALKLNVLLRLFFCVVTLCSWCIDLFCFFVGVIHYEAFHHKTRFPSLSPSPCSSTFSPPSVNHPSLLYPTWTNVGYFSNSLLCRLFFLCTFPFVGRCTVFLFPEYFSRVIDSRLGNPRYPMMSYVENFLFFVESYKWKPKYKIHKNAECKLTNSFW